MKRFPIQFMILAALLAPLALQAQVMTSTNYKIQSDDLSGGGLHSSSSNYLLNDTLAEVATPTGEDLASATYSGCAGFECLPGEAFLTVNFATSASPCTASSTSTPPFLIPLGTLTTSAVSTSSQHICVSVSTNATDGVDVGIEDAAAALASASVPADKIDSATATLVAGTPGYGVCATNAAHGLTAQPPYDGACDTTGGHAVGPLRTAFSDIFRSSGPLTDGYGDVLTKAAISTTLHPHADYTDTITMIVTATF